MRYEIENGFIEVKENSIIICKNNNLQSYKILNSDMYNRERHYYCSNVDDDRVYTISISDSGIVEIEEGDSRIKENIIENNEKSDLNINVKVNHFKQPISLSEKTKKGIKKAIIWIIAIAGSMLIIGVVGTVLSNANYEAEQKKIREKAEREFAAAIEFSPKNYIGSYTITNIQRNGKVLAWDSFYGKDVYLEPSVLIRQRISGRVDISDDLIEYSIDYNNNGRYEVNEIKKYRCTIKVINQSGGGVINYNSGGGVNMYLLNKEQAQIEFNQNKDFVIYSLNRSLR